MTDDAAFVDEMAHHAKTGPFTSYADDDGNRFNIIDVDVSDFKRLVALARMGLERIRIHDTHRLKWERLDNGTDEAECQGCGFTDIDPEMLLPCALVKDYRDAYARAEAAEQQLAAAHETVKAQAIAAVERQKIKEGDTVPIGPLFGAGWQAAVAKCVRALTALGSVSV